MSESASVLMTNSLTVHAIREGVATLRLHASAPGFRDTTLTIEIVSRVLCPLSAPASAADFFPNLPAAGIAFTYHRTYSSSRQNQYTDTDGTLRITPSGAATCYRGTRTTPLAYAFEGVSGGTPFARQATETATEDSTNIVTLPFYFIGGFSRRVVFARYGDSGTEQAIAAPFAGYTGPTSCRSVFRFSDDVGLVSEMQGGCYYGFGVTDSWSFTRAASRTAGV